MNVLDYLENKNNQDNLIKLIKVVVIGLTSFSLLANAIPFYLGFDDVNYGIAAINLSQGNLVVTNELLQTTGDSQFIPKAYVITSDGKSAVPKASVGIHVVGALLYSLGGFYALLYFGPIVSIILLILYERFVSKFFGNLVGLFALLLLAADWQFFFVGLRFLTDNIFTLFFILGLFSFLKFIQSKQEKYILLCSIFFIISTLFRITGIVFLAVEVFVVASMYALPYFSKLRIFIKNSKADYSETILKTTIFSKTNFTKFLKLSFYLFIPWLFFILFWFSYNDYFFGDINTNYREQIKSGSIDLEELEIESTQSEIKQPVQEPIQNYFERFNLVQYFSVPLISDPFYFFLVIISDTDLDEWRSDIWIGYVSLAILSIALITSLYFRTKRKEVIILLIFIVSLVGFYSSPLVSGSPIAPNLSEHANSRYMIPVSIISFILIGNLLVELWKKNLANQSSINKILKPIKKTYLVLIFLFFSALIIFLPSIQDFNQIGVHFNNPIIFANTFNAIEKLPEGSLIVGYDGRESLLHTDTHFYPYGKKFIEENGNPERIPESKIKLLKKIIEDGYTAYSFKYEIFPYDAKYFQELEENHGIILQDYSKTFCQLKIVSDDNLDGFVESDSDCLQDISKQRKKIWPVTLKWPP